MIDAVTQALVAHVHAQTPELDEWVVIHSLAADEPGPDEGRLVAALLAVEELDHVVNAPPGEALAGRRRARPLQLRLHYLFTYLGPHAEAMARLNRLIDVLQAAPVLEAGELTGLTETVERITLRLRNTTVEERQHVWATLGRPGRLAVFYTVDVLPRTDVG